MSYDLTVRTLALAVMIVTITVSARAQDGKARALYDESWRMVEISNLVTSEEQTTCARFVKVGRVVEVRYDNQHNVADFTIKGRGVWRFSLKEADIDEADARRLPTLLKEGQRLRVVAFGCGAAAAILDAANIDLIR